MSKFVKERSKILLVSSIISFLIFIIICPTILNYSKFISSMSNPIDLEIIDSMVIENSSFFLNQMAATLYEFDIIFCTILCTSCLLNVVGYIYKKSEFIIISVGLSIIAIIISIYMNTLFFIVLMIVWTILNILGTIEQYKILKK